MPSAHAASLPSAPMQSLSPSSKGAPRCTRRASPRRSAPMGAIDTEFASRRREAGRRRGRGSCCSSSSATVAASCANNSGALVSSFATTSAGAPVISSTSDWTLPVAVSHGARAEPCGVASCADLRSRDCSLLHSKGYGHHGDFFIAGLRGVNAANRCASVPRLRLRKSFKSGRLFSRPMLRPLAERAVRRSGGLNNRHFLLLEAGLSVLPGEDSHLPSPRRRARRRRAGRARSLSL